MSANWKPSFSQRSAVITENPPAGLMTMILLPFMGGSWKALATSRKSRKLWMRMIPASSNAASMMSSSLLTAAVWLMAAFLPAEVVFDL
ncbi:MAG: hypothetical protein BWZ01_03051 [Deltaproteobacteria bacterium ADurb.BinA179]|nr:MAG: hypothetical protein BWZ01_03051 [Deltaproteobacteria bacterium ADurb.BinA179]